jgi:hypothetical protein
VKVLVEDEDGVDDGQEELTSLKKSGNCLVSWTGN